MCLFGKKREYTQQELEEIRRKNEPFDFGLSGKSNDDPNKWIDEMEMFDELMGDDEDW